MALSASTVWEIRSSATASNANGGFFVTGASGTDFSQQDAAQYNLTGCTSAGADAIILNANAAAVMVGNAAHVISGTNATAGWYEIISVVPGVSITVDRNWGSGAVANGVVNIGGALSLGSSDDAVFESFVAGNTVYVKQGSYTFGGTVAVGTGIGSSTVPINIEGYATARGDRPTGSTRPTINCAATLYTTGTNVNLRNIIFTGTATSLILLSGANQVISCKMINTSTTAGRDAILMQADVSLMSCEAISYRGYAIRATSNGSIIGCYIHDSDEGIRYTGTLTSLDIVGCIVESCVTAAVNFSGASTTRCLLSDNTFYGSESKTGIGLSLTAGTTDTLVMNCIFYGFVTGVTHGTAGQTVCIGPYNAFYNNTTNATNWTLGTGSLTSAISFTNVAQVTGTAGTTASSILTDAAADFSNVVANQDFCYLVSGTGITAGQYLITAKTATSITLSPAPGDNATADKVYKVTTGRNFTPTSTNVRGTGFPGSFPAGLTTSAVDIGASQSLSGGGGGKTNHLGQLRIG